jgi:hypothetical protein
MQGTRKGKTDPEYARSEMGLGRCLVEGDPEAMSRARRTRRNTFGVSLAIEILLLGLLVAAPLFSSVAQPRLRRILPPQLTFFGAWREHNPAQHVVLPITAHKPAIPNPFPQPAAPVTSVDTIRPEDPGVPLLDLPGGDLPGTVQMTEMGGRRRLSNLPASHNRRNKKNVP